MGEIYIIMLALFLGLPLFVLIVYKLRRAMQHHDGNVRGREPPPPPTGRNIDPVTLDRSPNYPHRPGATS